MKLIIAGGRDFKPTPETDHLMKVIFSCYPIEEIVSGLARGADQYGVDQAKLYGIPVKPFPADWDDLEAAGAIIKYRKKDGKPYNAKAGHDRNLLMAEYGTAVVLLPGGSGTSNMRKLALDHKLIVIHDAEIKKNKQLGLFGENK